MASDAQSDDAQCLAEGAEGLLGRWAERQSDLIVIVDADGEATVRYVNAAAAAAAGRSRGRLVGRALVQTGLFGAEARTLRQRVQATLTAGGAPFELSWARGALAVAYAVDLILDPERRCVLVQARPCGRPASEPTFRRLTENLPDVIIRYGLDGRAVYCNREIGDQVTVSAHSLLGRTPTEAAPPGMRGIAEYEAQMRQTLATGSPGLVELHVPHPDGSLRVHSVAFAAERDAEGTISGVIVVGRDTTEQAHMREALAAKEREFRTLAENSPDVIVRYDRDMRIVYCNPELPRRQGVPIERILGRKALQTMPPGRIGRDAYLRQLEETLVTGRRGAVDLQSPDGERMRTFNVEFIAERDDDGAIRGALAVGREVTAQVDAAQALAAKEREFRSLAENAGDNIVRWDEQARMSYANPAFVRLFGRPVEALLGTTPLELDASQQYRPVFDTVLRVLDSGQPEMLELRMTVGAGQREQVHQIRCVPELDDTGRVRSVLGIGRDITEGAVYLEKIEALVRTDSLTQLPNRQALLERAPALLAASDRHSRQTALLLLDLDRFKGINDALGQAAGDAVLCATAQRLTACLRANDLLVRQGDDEFVVIAPDIDDAEAVGAIAGKLQRAVAAPLTALGVPVDASASIGVALFPSDGESIEALLAHAASAMQLAKRSGRGRTEYYRRDLGEAVQRRLLLEATMREATRGTGLVLHLQPQVCLANPQHIVGAEALLRWQHPDLGLLAPDAFIGIAEDNGAIVPIGHWVMRTAAEAAVRCNRGRAVPLHIALNVSTRQFSGDDLAAALRRVLEETGCEPAWLSIEITESALLEESQRVQQAFVALRALGVRIALDDFGTGYSALNYLAHFEVDFLKIDKSFVQGIERSAREAELVKAFIAMASALNLGLVAEGVETEAQAAFLRAHGCPQAQGWLYGRPMPIAAFEALVSGG